MTPELKAFRYYKKNINEHLEKLEPFWGNDEAMEKIYKELADKFSADHQKLMNIIWISYEREVDRAFR